jgi:MFS family permease
METMKTSKLYTTSVIILSISALVENLAYALPMSYFPKYIQFLGGPIAYIGLFTATFTTANAILSQKLGSISDRIGRKKLIAIGLIMDIFLGSLTGIIWDWSLLLIIRLLNGVATAAVAAPAEASLVDQIPKERRGEAIGFYLTMSMIGFNLGPVFGGAMQYLGEEILNIGLEWSYRFPFFIDSLLALIALLLVWLGVKETRGVQTPKELIIQNKQHMELTQKVKSSLKILNITSLTTGFSVGFIIPISVLYFTDVFQATSPQIGIILSLSGFVGLTCNFFAGKISDRIGRKPIITLGALPSRIATIIFPFAPTLISSAIVMVFRSFGHNIAMPASRALNADLIPERLRGKLFGRMRAFFSLGAILGPILSTWIYDTYRFQTFVIPWIGNLTVRGAGIPFLISSIVGLFSLFLLLTFVEEPKRT